MSSNSEPPEGDADADGALAGSIGCLTLSLCQNLLVGSSSLLGGCNPKRPTNSLPRFSTIDCRVTG